MLLLHFVLCQSWRNLEAKLDQSGGSGSVQRVITTYRVCSINGLDTLPMAQKDVLHCLIQVRGVQIDHDSKQTFNP